MKRRSVLIGAGAATATMALGGCGVGGGSGRTQLLIWQTETDEGAKRKLDAVRTAFEAKNPNVDVVIESIPWGSLAARLNSAIRTNSLPDIAHVQPFMTYSLVERGLLEPITALVNELNGSGRIFPAVLNLQRFDGEFYGLAYAVGVTGWTFDLSKAGPHSLPYPTELDGTIGIGQFLEYLTAVKRENPKATLLLPGGTPFFIDQLVGELVSNAGGRLYDPSSGNWLFESAEVKAVYAFLHALKKRGLLDPDWQAQSYTDQFPRLATADGVFVTPVTYARASVAIKRTLDGTPRSGLANDRNFRFMSPPTFPGAAGRGVKGPVATIDCEPFVLFRARAREKFGPGLKRDLSLAFLRAFYQPQAYLDFCKQVPIHLTPIFRDIAGSAAYQESLGQFVNWHEHTMAFLENPIRTRPILVAGHDPATLEADLKNPYLLDLQARNIISDSIVTLLTDPSATVDTVLATTQARATDITRGREEASPSAS